MDSPLIISATGINKTVMSGDTPLEILKNVNLNVTPGQSIAILGVSGAGKSTLLGLLAGLDIPSKGTISLANQNITQMDEEQRAQTRADQVGFVFQNFQLLENLNALENVMLPLELKSIKDAKQRAQTWLERVGLAARENHYPQQLSGGEQQRVAIARAFAAQPSILFADEPTGNLDKKTAKQVIDLLFKLNQEKQTTLIVVTHDEQLAARCDKQYQLDGGELHS